MKDKTKDQLIRELEKLHRKNAKLERMKNDYSRIKEELHASESRLSNALEIARAGYWEYDVASDTFTFNDNFYRIFRTTAGKMGGYRMSSADYLRRLCHPDDAALIAGEIQAAIESGDLNFNRRLEHRIVYADGEVGYIVARVFTIKGKEGRIVKAYGVNQDITEYRKVEEELKLANLLLTTQQEVSIDGIMVFGLEGRIISFNKRFIDMWGIPREAIESRSYERTIPYVLDKLTEPERFLERARYLRENSHETSGVEISLVDGSIFEHYSAPMERADGRNYGRVWFFHDITQGRRAEEKIIHSEEMFRALFMSMGEGFYLSEVIYDDKGNPCDYKYLEVNPKFEQILGLPRDRIIGKRYKEIVPNDTTQWLDNYCRVALTGEPRTFEFYSAEYRMYFETYSYRPAKGQVSVIVKNITERKKLEDQLRQAQKMEAIGMLAGGIAHDFNNILMALTGFAALLQMNMKPGDPLHEYVDQIVSASQKAVDLTKSLSAFSRQQPVVFRPLGMNDIIKGAEKLLKRLVTEDVTIKTALSPEEPVIMADAAQMDQVILNLASNANDAMPNGGTLVIETKCLELDDEFRRLHGFGKPGKYALLCVSDNGTGMDEAVKRKIFDPFFTTKEVGKGTGLGLSTVYGIVKQHNGYITVYSEPGVGTTFSMYFPMASGPVEKEKAATAPVKGGKEVILIAEDNASVRNLMMKVLTKYGYAVIEAADGVDAVEQFRKSGKIDLLILDSIMPGKNGRETYNEIRNTRPDIRVLFTSGYTRDIILNKGIEDKKFHFISKPVRPVDLLNKVREILDQQAAD